MSTTYTKATDAIHKVTVTSNIIYCVWRSRCGYAGEDAPFEVRTSLVGEGAPIEIVGRTGKGKKCGKVTDTISRNRYDGEFPIPDNFDWGEQIYLEVKLSKHGLQMESNRIPVRSKIQVKSLAWDRKEARRDDVVKLTAEFKNLSDGTEATVIIYEFLPDGYQDPIASFPVVVKKNKIQLDWAYEYQDDTAEIPTQKERRQYGKNYNHPQFFFVVDFDGVRIGEKQESGLLKFRDWVTIELKNQAAQPIPKEDYILHLPDGSTRKGTLNEKGKAEEKDVPPGKVSVEFPNL
jgi:hypothetical protein